MPKVLCNLLGYSLRLWDLLVLKMPHLASDVHWHRWCLLLVTKLDRIS
jgi:hypothetical protein